MQKQIFYHDTDAGNVVYYANYLKYMEEARTEFFAKKGLTVAEIQKRGFLYAVRKCAVTYKSPARYGDIISCDAQLQKVTAAQFMFTQQIHNTKDNRLLVDAEVTLVSLNTAFQAVPIPDDIRALLEG